MTGMVVFPTRLFSPSSLKARVTGQSLGGGVSFSGEQQGAEIGGGGRFTIDFGESALLTPAMRQAWAGFRAKVDGLATPILVPLADRLMQPVNPKYTGGDTFGLSSWVADPTAWTATEVTAVTTEDAALGATTLAFNLTAPRALLDGARLSILDATWGWRLYEFSRVTAGGTVGEAVATTACIRPPLRAALPSGSALNLESPRGMMQSIGDLGEVVSLLRTAKPTANFVEWPGPLPT